MTRFRKRLWFFVIPSMVLVLGVAIYPLFWMLRTSFTNMYLPRAMKARFIGLDNYGKVLSEQYMLNSLKVTVMFVVGAVLLELVLGMALALLLNSKIKGRGFFRAAFILPLMVPPIVAAMNWKALLHPAYGAVNYYLRFIFGEALVGDWLANRFTALPTLMVVDAWQWTPFMALVLLAGLQTMPVETYEAAQIDGASGWQQFWKITIPLMRNIIMAAVLIRMIDALKMFDLVYVMTEGGPGISTETLSFLIFKTGVKFFQLGQAGAFAIVYLFGVTLLAILVHRNLRREREA
jgi:multiple sugar transport system permease protein